jgi:ferredoxin
MAKYKIIFTRKECIGAAECEAVSPALWQMQNDSKASLKGAVFNEKTGNFELEIDDELLTEQEAVAGSCPAGCISLAKV